MDNMIFVALMVVSFILINPHLSAATEVKDVAAVAQAQSQVRADDSTDDSDEDEEEEEDEEPSH